MSSTWPMSGGNTDLVTPGNILWTTVKTEEEEYLDKLQSKLSRIMENGPTAPPMRTGHTDMHPEDDLLDDTSSPPPLHDDDPGLHLLYNFPLQKDRCPSPTPSTQSDPAPKPAARQRLVRFRSRVRITSGVHLVASRSSSTCESISSSISAPLRDWQNEASARPGALSSVVSSNGTSAWLRGTGPAQKPGYEQRGDAGAADERSSLTSWDRSRVRTYTDPNDGDEDDDAEYDRMQAAARKSEEDVMFGPWPWRLINRHWWWWKLEPLLCCCAQFDDESDEE